MGEFVENSLEGLLPVYEQLGNVQLLSPQEVTGFVKKCRQYEYRLQKREKAPRDFHLYGDYLNDVLTLIQSRRCRQNYFHKKDLIEKPLLHKIASIYRRCCDRFPGSIDLWLKLIHFLNRNNLRRILSKAYTRALQVHGRNVNLRIESALWEFFSNASVDNARAQLQLSIRMSPQEYRYYTALFRVEVHYVEKIMSRREFLRKTAQEIHQQKDNENDAEIDDSVFDVDVDDSVLQLRVPEIIVNSAVKSVVEDNLGAMLISMKRCLDECSNLRSEAADRLQTNLHNRIVELNNEDTQLYYIQEAVIKKEDEFEAYEKALMNVPTEKMHRLFLVYVERRLEKEKNDPIAILRRSELLAKMLEEGWTSDKDMEKVKDLVHDVMQGDKKLLLEKALQKNPKSPIFWAEWLQYRIDNESFETGPEKKSFLAELNSAFDKVLPEEAFPLWEIALEFAVRYTSDNVEEVFAKASKMAHPSVASRVKIVRLQYLKALLAEGKIQRHTFEKEITGMMQQKPNETNFYLAVAEQALAEPECNHKLVKLAFNFAVVENGHEELTSWLQFIRYSLKHDPLAVSQLYSRAILKLEPSLCEEFITAWTTMNHEKSGASVKAAQSEKRQMYTDSKEDVKSSIGKKKRKL